jgi:branched-chain amino acid transport system permease protein
VILGAVLLAVFPEVLRHTVVPVQQQLFGKVLVDAEVLRMLLYGLAMVAIMLYRPKGLWPSPEHGISQAAKAENVPRTAIT